MPKERPIYIDIDGTLTDAPGGGGEPLLDRLDHVRQMIARGVPVVVWSGNGEDYAEFFCAKHQLKPHAILGKPTMCVDDNPRISPSMVIASPEEFFREQEIGAPQEVQGVEA